MFPKRRRQPESDVLKVCLDYFMVRRVYCERMQAGGAYRDDARGVRSFINLHTEGCADLLAFPYIDVGGKPIAIPLWVECKQSRTARVRPSQKSFERHMRTLGMHYIRAWSLDQVVEWFIINRAHGLDKF